MLRLPSFFKFLNLQGTHNVSRVNQITTGSFPLQFRASPALWAEPLKKKKRVDPNIIKAREEKRKRRIEKEIRKLKKSGRQLKPIFELEIPYCLIDNSESRKRDVTVSEEVIEERIKVLKEWGKVKCFESKSDVHLIDRLLFAQQQALDELKLESEELYQSAVMVDPNLIPFKFTGPCETPPKADYGFLDGEYVDESRKWL